jgi:N-acetyl-gamma-glutamylphosphate reductase
MLDVSIAPDPVLKWILDRHPRVTSVRDARIGSGIEWAQGDWRRSVLFGRPDIELAGVVELCDNNPLVCGDLFSVPDPASTLALLALGPLAEAGLIVERPTLLINTSTSEEEIGPWLDRVGWGEGLTVACEDADLASVIAATVITKIATPARLDDLDDLYDERYGRSFFVRRDEESEWHVSLVLERPFALYRIRVSEGDPHSLLTVQVMADRDGKCGAAQIVHAFNVMCGFEESLGLES